MTIKNKYEFADIYYADLNPPKYETDKFYDYLHSQQNAKIYYINVKIPNNTIEKVLIFDKVNNLEDYIFITTDLAGTGINYFIIETDENDIQKVMDTFFINMPLREFDDNLWIDDLLKLGIKTIHKAYADGAIVYSYKA